MAKRKGKTYLSVLILVLIAILIFFISRLSIFEKNPPQILMPDVVYTDLKKPILVHIKDDESSIKNVQIILHKDDNTSAMVIADEKISNLKDITLQVALPKFGYKENVKSFVLEVIAKDSSFWNFFSGNEARKQIAVLVDNTAPKINIISNSYQIEQGGAG
ncbi:TPA: M23 family peptidase, partial [Campylobacter jejuni]|nr:M23 family peptidase [Campylobacter jejuni]